MPHAGKTTGSAIALLMFLLVLAATAGPVDKTVRTSWDFDDIPVGQLPPGWKVDATNGNCTLATWQVISDRTAPSGDQVLGLMGPKQNSGNTFNLCWTDSVTFLDGEIEVRFRADQGREDQGGGIIWRVQDRDNYYIARFNPLEDNFRLYSVHDGVRKTLASANIALSPAPWHLLRITQHGHRFAGSLDGQVLLTGTDDLFPGGGGVGLWTKADAATSFDSFSVTASGKLE